MNEVTRALVLLSLACTGPGPRSGSGNQELPGGVTKEAPSEDRLEDQIDITGVIRYFELEGGFFAILSDDGETYHPTNLPPDFRQDGLPVAARAKLRNDLMGVHQAGPIVEIIEIRKR